MMANRPVRPKTQEGHRAEYPIVGGPNGWHFRIEEISQGYYAAKGADVFGRQVSRTGTDPEALLAECIEDAIHIVCSAKLGE